MIYSYEDHPNRTLLFQVIRKKGKRGFPQRRPDGKGGWIYDLDGVKRVLYRFPELMEADPESVVFVVEGEKDVESLRARGLVATCNPGGALKWKDEFSEPLRGRKVVVLRDNDERGLEHVAGTDKILGVLPSLHGKARSLKMVDLPDLPPKGDVSDFLLKGGTVEQLYRLVESAPEWEPSKVQKEGLLGFLGDPPQVRQISTVLRPVPPMVGKLIPEPFRDWLEDIAKRACCPLDLPAMAAIVSVAAAVGRKVAIRPKRQDDWTVVPNLWGMGVLPPGWLKSHCLEEPKTPLARLEIDAREEHANALREFAVTEAVAASQIEAAKAALKAAAKRGKDGAAVPDETLRDLAAETLAKPALVPPTQRRHIINDATVEKLGELLAENPNGLLPYRDELMGFLKSLEKQGHEGDRAFYLESWNGTGSYSYDRIRRGTLFIPSNTLSILGGIQPGKLASYIRNYGSGEDDDGFISRFQLAVYPDTDQPFVNVDSWPNTEAKNRAYSVFKALANLDPATIGAETDEHGPAGIPYLRFSGDAQPFFDKWRYELETKKIRSSREASNLIAHLAKYRSLMPSLALLFHLIAVAGGKDTGPVSLDAARRSAAWCEYLEEHARRIYQAAFDGDPEPAQRLVERLKESLPNPFAPYQVVQKGWKSLDSIEAVNRAIAMAEDQGWLYRNEIPPGPMGGRPKIEIHFNPRLLEGGAQ